MAEPRLLSKARLRPAQFDDLGLRRVLGDRMLPLLVAAMAFLAALALAGAVGAAALARHWQEGAAAAVTVQVPHPGTPFPGTATAPEETRLERAMSILRATPAIATARPLTDSELSDLLRPWLGSTAETLALPLPAVIEVHLAAGADDAPAALAPLAAQLEHAVPGTLLESHGVWVTRLAVLARSLQACAWAALGVVAAVAAAVISVATRAGLAARRDAIDIVHSLGATDGYIAGRFARRATTLAGMGGALGALTALPVLVALTAIAAPFTDNGADPPDGLAAAIGPGAALLGWIGALPASLWLLLPGLPLSAALIGFLTAQFTVHRWLRRLP